MVLPTNLSDWLINGEGWIEYSTRVELLHQSPTSPEVAEAKNSMIAHRLVQGLIAELTNWPGVVIASHKSAAQPFHKLTFLADIGLTRTDPGIAAIITRILAHQSQEGPFTLPLTIGAAYGGTGQETGGWALCDAPLLLYALIKFGTGVDPNVQKGVQHLLSLVRNNGWPCVVSKELGNWRGPGKKEDPCPFATLAMLKLCTVDDQLLDSSAARLGTSTLLDLWEKSRIWHPFIFYMGVDFRKLKIPFIWYDLMHVLEVLSHFPWVLKDARYQDMLEVLRQKMDENGRFCVESVWNAWKDWEFGQKKVPSRWLTFAAWRILERSNKGTIS